MKAREHQPAETAWMLAVRAHLETEPATKQQFERELEEAVAALNEERATAGALPVAVPDDDEVVAYIARLMSVGTEISSAPVT